MPLRVDRRTSAVESRVDWLVYRWEPGQVVERLVESAFRRIFAFRRTLELHTLAAGWMLTITFELDLVSGLLTVLAAEFPERTMGFDVALTRGMRALRC